MDIFVANCCSKQNNDEMREINGIHAHYGLVDGVLALHWLTGKTYPWREFFSSVRFNYNYLHDMPREETDEGKIVPKYPVLKQGYYMFRGFCDIDNNKEMLEEDIGRSYFGSTKFTYHTHHFTMDEFKNIVDAVMNKKARMDHVDLTRYK